MASNGTRVTIQDVAREAEVSAATVSYVLTGNRPISDQTRRRVLSVVERLSYVRNANAQALKLDRSMTIGLVIYDFFEPAVFRALAGVKATAQRHHYAVFFVSELGYAIEDTEALAARRQIDGLLMLSGITSERRDSGGATPAVPTVSVNHLAEPGVPSVVPDNFEGGRRAAAHLLERGCRRLAMIAGPRDRDASNQRLAGFRAAIAEAGFAAGDAPVVHGSLEYDGGVRGLDALLGQGARIDGLFCGNDLVAAGAIQAALARGFAVPEGLKVVGYDATQMAAIWPIPITTIDPHMEELGALGAEILIGRIGGESPEEPERRVRTTLIPRESSAPRPRLTP